MTCVDDLAGASEPPPVAEGPGRRAAAGRARPAPTARRRRRWPPRAADRAVDAARGPPGPRPAHPRQAARAARVAVAVAGLDGRPVLRGGPARRHARASSSCSPAWPRWSRSGPSTASPPRSYARAGALTLVGGGDPLLARGAADADALPARGRPATLARRTAAGAAARRRPTRVRLRYDDSLFTRPGGQPRTGSTTTSPTTWSARSPRCGSTRAGSTPARSTGSADPSPRRGAALRRRARARPGSTVGGRAAPGQRAPAATAIAVGARAPRSSRSSSTSWRSATTRAPRCSLATSAVAEGRAGASFAGGARGRDRRR